jgi:hypothetical protein
LSASTKRVRAAVFARADGACEACGKFVSPETGHLDHFFGRAKAVESLENCWALCVPCDDAKTRNAPTAAIWLAAFINHADRYGYTAAIERAFAKLQVLQAKGRAA